MSSLLKITATITAGIVVTSIIVYHKEEIAKCYNKHRGIQGLARYIWIGDYLPPSIRKSMDELDEISKDMTKCDPQLERIEMLVQRALLESVDGPALHDLSEASDSSKEEIHKQIFKQNPELRKDIGFFSTKLDRLAARIDSVLSHGDDEVKIRKKLLSNKAVLMMDGLDSLLASFYVTLT